MVDSASLVARLQLAEDQAFDGAPFYVTDHGIWVPTPLPVVSAGIEALAEAGYFDAGPTVLDAGMGDGRLVAWLATHHRAVRALGIEGHPALHAVAHETLRTVPSTRWSIAVGDYLRPQTYRDLGVAPDAIDLVFNYPDGNEGALLGFLRTHGRRGAWVVFWTPDRRFHVGEETAARVLPIARGFALHAFAT